MIWNLCAPQENVHMSPAFRLGTPCLAKLTLASCYLLHLTVAWFFLRLYQPVIQLTACILPPTACRQRARKINASRNLARVSSGTDHVGCKIHFGGVAQLSN